MLKKGTPAGGLGSIMNATPAARKVGKAVDQGWKGVQKKTFSNWANYQVSRKDTEAKGIEMLYEDLADGEILMNILEGCIQKPCPGKKMKTSKMKIQQLEKLGTCFKFMAENDVKLVNIGPEDINDGNPKLVLGLIWTLIAKFTISVLAKDVGGSGSAKEILMLWLNSKLDEHCGTVTDFGKCWMDGKLLVELVNCTGRTVYDADTTLIEDDDSMSAFDRATLALKVAEEKLSIPQLISATDLTGEVRDEHSTMAYLALYKNAAKPAPPKKVEVEAELVDEDENDDMYAAPPVTTGKNNGDDDDDDDGDVYGTPANFAKGGTGVDNLNNHVQEPDLYALPPVRDSKAKAKKDEANKDDDEDDGTYKDVAPGPAKGEKAEKVEYTTVEHEEPQDDDDGTYKDVCPTERPDDWRSYEGEDLGGRCKIRVFFSTTTSDRDIRNNTQDLMKLLEKLKVHERPDFEPWIPVDMDMDRDFRNKIFEKAGTRKTPLLFVDDEFVGGWDMIKEMTETDYASVEKMFKY
eukprot:m.12257 g.12257  ORF g.12257 m.12257 type:complete len:520 (-) comp9231_c0_seq1:408-1967(-)